MSLRDAFAALSMRRIEGLVRTGHEAEETLHLEFKTVRSKDLSAQDDKKNFVVALSGFANSEGGILVLGSQRQEKR